MWSYIRKKLPKVILLEQVPGLITNKKLKKAVFNRWMNESLVFQNSFQMNDMCSIYVSSVWQIYLRFQNLVGPDAKPLYNVYVKILNANGYVPQNRKRLFIVALKKKYQKKPFSFPTPPKSTLKFQSLLNTKYAGSTRLLDPESNRKQLESLK